MCFFFVINLFTEIVEKVKDIRREPVRPDQPKLIDNDANPQMLNLMQNCWEEDPTARPDISHVLKQLKTINKGRWVLFLLFVGGFFFYFVHPTPPNNDTSPMPFFWYHRRKFNIMDNMIQKLEKYANNLEEIVEARTEELVEEKKKIDLLLYRMLPE